MRQSEDYTKRKSLNLIGINKQRTNDEKTPRFYDIENLTFNYSYNEVNHRDYEIENMLSLRDKARENKNYKEADRIRDELLDKGVLIEDKDGKTTWKFK